MSDAQTINMLKEISKKFDRLNMFIQELIMMKALELYLQMGDDLDNIFQAKVKDYLLTWWDRIDE